MAANIPAEFETLQRRIADLFDRVAPLIIQQSVSGFLGLLFRFALLPGPNAVVDLIEHGPEKVMNDYNRREAAPHPRRRGDDSS